MDNMEFKGVISGLLTPFLTDTEIDYAALEEEVKFQVKSGAKGLFVNGFANEPWLMSDDEQMKVLETVVRVAKGKALVVATISSNTIASALDMLKRYEQAGADAIAIAQPMVSIYTFTKDAMFEYYSKLIKSTKLPVYIDNITETSNILPPDIVARLINENSNLRGYKDGTRDIIHLQTLLSLVEKGRHFELISGSDRTILPILLLGGVGAISLTASAFPELIIDLCNAYFEGDIKKAKELQFKTLQVRRILRYAPPFTSGFRYALSLRLPGYSEGYYRLPSLGTNENQRKYIKENLEKIGLL